MVLCFDTKQNKIKNRKSSSLEKRTKRLGTSPLFLGRYFFFFLFLFFFQKKMALSVFRSSQLFLRSGGLHHLPVTRTFATEVTKVHGIRTQTSEKPVSLLKSVPQQERLKKVQKRSPNWASNAKKNKYLNMKQFWQARKNQWFEEEAEMKLKAAQEQREEIKENKRKRREAKKIRTQELLVEWDQIMEPVREDRRILRERRALFREEKEKTLAEVRKEFLACLRDEHGTNGNMYGFSFTFFFFSFSFCWHFFSHSLPAPQGTPRKKVFHSRPLKFHGMEVIKI